jgi:hypothetical protein
MPVPSLPDALTQLGHLGDVRLRGRDRETAPADLGDGAWECTVTVPAGADGIEHVAVGTGRTAYGAVLDALETAEALVGFLASQGLEELTELLGDAGLPRR